MPNYVARLLSASGGEISQAPPAERLLLEPLTERETEVLALLAAGLTNQEIAKELIISPLTVKKHASNIYDKLDVRGRTGAGARARELGLLD